MPKNLAGALPSRSHWAQVAAWSLGLAVTLLAIIAWGSNLAWHLTPLNAYIVFPVLGLVAYSLMWSHYILGSTQDMLGWDKSILKQYFSTTGWAVLILICFHPGLLIYQRFRDGFGLPPGSYESYVAPGLGWVTLLGTASLLVFLAYEFYRVFGERSWWHYIRQAGDIAMLAIFYHGLRLGTDLQGGHWFQLVWWFYGVTLATVLIRSYLLKYRHRKSGTD
jgi:hypothetical protein